MDVAIPKDFAPSDVPPVERRWDVAPFDEYIQPCLAIEHDAYIAVGAVP
jgi:hypothetical protein